VVVVDLVRLLSSVNVMPANWIPMSACRRGVAYLIRSRNLVVGVYDGKGGFLGLREKFGAVFVFTEYRDETGLPFGTVFPLAEIETAPDHLELTERLSTASGPAANAALKRYLEDLEERRLCATCRGQQQVWQPDDGDPPARSGGLADCSACGGTGLRSSPESQDHGAGNVSS